MADGFAQIFHNGLTADASLVPGAGRAAVRVIVPAVVLTDGRSHDPEMAPTDSAILEESMSAISFDKLGEYLCEGGIIGVAFGENGQVLDAGREQRLFTRAQRTALGVRCSVFAMVDAGSPAAKNRRPDRSASHRLLVARLRSY
jgi:hypothetical protein